jgi:hypothetical protein
LSLRGRRTSSGSTRDCARWREERRQRLEARALPLPKAVPSFEFEHSAQPPAGPQTERKLRTFLTARSRTSCERKFSIVFGGRRHIHLTLWPCRAGT